MAQRYGFMIENASNSLTKCTFNNKNQQIRLQVANFEDVTDTVLLVDRNARIVKECSMYNQYVG